MYEENLIILHIKWNNDSDTLQQCYYALLSDGWVQATLND